MLVENLDIEFKPGDRVVLVKSFAHLKAGDTGVFVHEDEGSWPELGVRWDNEIRDGHDCAGNCEDGYGWYVPIGYLDFAEPTDLGDLPEADYGSESILFGL